MVFKNIAPVAIKKDLIILFYNFLSISILSKSNTFFTNNSHSIYFLYSPPAFPIIIFNFFY